MLFQCYCWQTYRIIFVIIVIVHEYSIVNKWMHLLLWFRGGKLIVYSFITKIYYLEFPFILFENTTSVRWVITTLHKKIFQILNRVSSVIKIFHGQKCETVTLLFIYSKTLF